VEIFASQGAPPVSTPPVANFVTGTTGVVDTGGKFATSVTIPAANLPPVSTHRCQLATGINDTGGNFAAGVIDTGGK
jgi:hypothetical protein